MIDKLYEEHLKQKKILKNKRKTSSKIAMNRSLIITPSEY